MPCVHTGAELYLPQYRKSVRADLFLLRGGVVVAKYYRGAAEHGVEFDPVTMYLVRDVGDGLFESGDAALLVMTGDDLAVPTAEEHRW